MKGGEILYKIDPKNLKIYVSINGSAIFENAHYFKALVGPFASAGYEIIIDLSHVDYIDSTFLGTLALIKNTAIKGIIIVNTSHHILGYFKNMNLHTFFNFLKDTTINIKEFKPLKSGELSRGELARDILDAHRELLRLNPNKKQVLGRIIDNIERELID